MARILVGTADGLRAFDEGGNPGPVELEGQDVTALGTLDDDLWAVVDEREVWRRNGAEWERLAELDGYRATCIAFTDELIVGTSEARLFRLVGGGLEPVDGFDAAEGRTTWSTPWGGPPDTRSISEWTPHVYVNVHVGGILRAEHGGNTWTPTIDVDADVHQVAATEGLVMAACAGGLAASTDLGETWTMRTYGLEARYSRAVVRCGDLALMSSSTGPRGSRAAVYRGGLMSGPFERCRDGLPEWFDDNIDTYCLDALPYGSLAAFGTSDGRLFASTDAGATWAPIVTGLPPVRRVLVLP
jgi:hypothetical protein